MKRGLPFSQSPPTPRLLFRTSVVSYRRVERWQVQRFRGSFPWVAVKQSDRTCFLTPADQTAPESRDLVRQVVGDVRVSSLVPGCPIGDSRIGIVRRVIGKRTCRGRLGDDRRRSRSRTGRTERTGCPRRGVGQAGVLRCSRRQCLRFHSRRRLAFTRGPSGRLVSSES